MGRERGSCGVTSLRVQCKAGKQSTRVGVTNKVGCGGDKRGVTSVGCGKRGSQCSGA